MNHVRGLVRSPSRVHQFLLTCTTALLLIVGLLAMHTLSGGLVDGHADATHPASVPAAVDAEADLGVLAAAASGSEATARRGSEAAASHCVSGCDGVEEAPGHAMSAMACVLALLAAAGLLPPALPVSVGVSTVSLPLHRDAILAALPHPRPPSLIVLSISRT